MAKLIRVGIIGCGGIANGKHMPSLKKVPDCEMVAFCDIIPERAVKAAEEYGTPDAKVYTDYRELLKDKTIDVVHVCTPNRSHSFITVDALEAGKQLLSGEEAMGLVRFRSGYADADLGRVQVQRDFLSALVKQAVSPEGALRSPLLLHILQTGTETDLTAGNFLWLAESVLLVDRNHIGTATLPGSARNFESGSYYVLDPASVAQTVNTYCNPYVQEITPEDLEIRTN